MTLNAGWQWIHDGNGLRMPMNAGWQWIHDDNAFKTTD
jgi:hypothetical protein